MSNERRLHPVDAAVLRHLKSGVDYPRVIAHRRGVDPVDVERRCERLAERGFVEPVSHEVVYRITDAGLRTLEAHRTARSDRSRTDDRERSPLEREQRLLVEERERSGSQQAGGQ